MTWFPLLSLAAASLKNRSGAALLTLLTITLSVMLFLGVEKIRYSTKASFEATLSGTDLIVGARSAPVNLLLASVFRLGSVPANISWESAVALAARPDVAWTVPLSLGDSHRGEPVLSTVPAYFTHYRYGNNQPLELAQGVVFQDLFDIVLGAATAARLGYRIGDEVELTHGLGQAGISDHDHLSFRVSGILKPTGTPIDRTLHTSLEAMTAVHAEEKDLVRTDLTPESVSAILIGLKNKASVLRTRRAINTYSGEALLAIMPGQTLGELWALTGAAERILQAVSVFVILVGLASALSGLLSGLTARRREMAILRSVGARKGYIGGLLVLEAVLMGASGALLGVILVNMGLYFGAPLLTARWGIVLIGTGLGALDVITVLAVTALAGLIGLIPAIMAYRGTLADGLNIRL